MHDATSTVRAAAGGEQINIIFASLGLLMQHFGH